MQQVLANCSASICELKKNPTHLLKESGGNEGVAQAGASIAEPVQEETG